MKHQPRQLSDVRHRVLRYYSATSDHCHPPLKPSEDVCVHVTVGSSAAHHPGFVSTWVEVAYGMPRPVMPLFPWLIGLVSVDGYMRLYASPAGP